MVNVVGATSDEGFLASKYDECDALNDINKNKSLLRKE